MNKILFKLLSAIIFMYAFVGYAQQKKINLGTTSQLKTDLIESYTKVKKSAKDKTNVKLKKNGATTDELIVTKVVDEKGTIKIFGYSKSDENQKLYLTFEGGKAYGHLMNESTEEAFVFSSQGEQVYLEEEDIHEVLCVGYKNRIPEEKTIRRGNKPLDDSPATDKLESLSGAAGVVYLDFDGEVVENTGWNDGERIDAAARDFSVDKIKKIWREVSEDMLPFNINVTTNVAVFNATPKTRRMQVIFTGSQEWRDKSSGGVAYVGSFNNNNNDPCWVFNSGTSSAAVTASHEIGHTFGLSHDGKKAVDGEEALSYYNGHGSWGTIMGGVTFRAITQWSKGEYDNANQFQDDLAIISATNNNFGYRADDHGNDQANATDLIIEPNGSVLSSKNDGVITTSDDKDFFKFTTGQGNVKFNLKPASYAANLNIEARILDYSGTQQAISNLTTSLEASFDLTLPAGTYYIEVDGVGDKDPKTDGYSDYGSIGYFSISGTIIFANQPKDCAGVESGTAAVDDCGVCAGGNTGLNPCFSLTDGYYNILVNHSNKCLHLNPNLKQIACDTSKANQVWHVTNHDGYYDIKNFDTEHVLSVDNTEAGTIFTATTGFNNTDSQLFRIEKNENGSASIIPKQDLTKVLNLSGNTVEDNENFILWTRAGSLNEQLTFTPMATPTKDCNNVLNGTAYEDFCDNCVAGNTAEAPCQVPYATHIIPGVIELEAFDNGGQGVSFNDASEENQGDLFRTELAVDLDSVRGGGYCLGWTETGEWTEYTVEILETGTYDLTYWTASFNNGGIFNIQLNGQTIVNNTSVENTGGWQNWGNYTLSDISLTEGVYVLRYNVVNGGLNADKLMFEKQTVTTHSNVLFDNGLQLYPNPVNQSEVTISTKQAAYLKVYNLRGVLHMEKEMESVNTLDLSSLDRGVYLFEFRLSDKVVTEKVVVQ